LEYQPQTTAFVSVVGGLAVLNLMWFAAAIRATLAEAGQDGWGAAATASSALVGGSLLLLISVGAAFANSIAGSGNPAFASGLSYLAWTLFVLSSFPRAMLIMSGSFGLWRPKLISNAPFAVFVLAVILVLVGGTTWLGGSVWAPDGLFTGRLTHHRPGLGCGGESGRGPQSCHAGRVVEHVARSHPPSLLQRPTRLAMRGPKGRRASPTPA
jgi:hypothetical protein